MHVVNRTITLIGVLCLSGCASLQSSAIGRDNLANRGPVVVSTSNPYLASNMLLAKETELNPTLRGFLKIKGKPEILEVEKELFKPYFIYFYYPSQKERYVLEESNGDWVIRGPEVLASDNLKSLTNIPVDLIPTSNKTPAEEVELSENVTEETQTSEMPPATKKEIVPALDDVDGDILHLVKYQGETLRLIAGWYTGNPDNAGRIARINGFKNANALILDQKIRIPRYLVTKDTKLTKDDVEFYLKR